MTSAAEAEECRPGGAGRVEPPQEAAPNHRDRQKGTRRSCIDGRLERRTHHRGDGVRPWVPVTFNGEVGCQSSGPATLDVALGHRPHRPSSRTSSHLCLTWQRGPSSRMAVVPAGGGAALI